MSTVLSEDESREIEGRWRRAALSTEPVDRDAAEKAVKGFRAGTSG